MKLLKRIIKWVFISLSTLILLLLLLVLFFNTDTGQRLLKTEVVKYLSEKLATKVVVEAISTNFLSYLEIQKITVADKTGKVLLHIGNIDVRYRLLDLLKNKLSISAVTIDTLDFRITRNEKDSVYNFDFIIQAFSDTASGEKTKDTSSSSLKFNFGKLTIKQLQFLMDDKRMQQYYDISGNKIEAAINNIDPAGQLYDIDYLKTDGLTAKIMQGIAIYEEEEQESNSGLLPIIKLGKLSLVHNTFSLDLKNNGISAESAFDNLNIEAALLDLNKYKLDLKQLLIDKNQSALLIKTMAAKPGEKNTSKTDSVAKPFFFSMGKIQLRNNNLRYDKDTTIVNKSIYFDANHLSLKQVQLELDNFSYDGSGFKGLLKELNATEQCGLDLQQLNVHFAYADSGITLKKLHLKTPFSLINGSLITSYESIAAVIADPRKLKLDINLNPLLIGKNDLQHFKTYAGENEQLKAMMSDDISIDGILKGSVADLKINKLKIKNNDFTISVSGNFLGLPDIEKVKGNLKIEEVSGTAKNFLKLVPPENIPENIAIPENFSINGTIAAQKEAYDLDLNLLTTDGDLSINGNIVQPTNFNKVTYDINIQSTGIKFDHLLKDTLYGNSAFDIHAKGQGIKPYDASLETTASIPFAFYNGHEYRNIALEALLDKSLLNTTFNINDSACRLNVAASYSFDTLHPFLSANGKIDIIDLQELNLVKDSLKLKAEFNTDRLDINSKHINGTADIRNIVITKGQNKYLLDTVAFVAKQDDSAQSLALHAPFMDFKLDGVYEINALQGVIQNLMVNYFVKNPIKSDSSNDAVASIEGELRYHPIIEMLLPGLTALSDINFNGKIDSRKRDLMIAVTMPQTTYNTIQIDSTVLTINTIADSLKINIATAGIDKDPIKLHNTQLSGRAIDGVISWDFHSNDSYDSLTYYLNGIFINDTAEINLSFGENQLINKETWMVSKDNKINYLFKKGLIADFQLSAGKKKLSVISEKNGNGLPVVLQLNDFPISTLTKIVNSDTAFAEGLINGSARLTGLNPMRFTTSINIDSLQALGKPLGQVQMTVKNDSGYSGNIKVKGEQIDLEATAALSDEQVINGDLNVSNFNLSVIEPFIKNYFSKTEGILQGNLSLSGSADKPAINGELNMKNMSGVYNAYGTFFNVPEQTIYFSDTGITLHRFIAYDSLKNTATIDGKLKFLSIIDYTYDFNIKTNHFLALNKKSNADQKLYGPAFLTADMKISSKNDLITVDGKVQIDEKSVINVELVKSDTTTSTGNGVILYYDQSTSADTLLAGKIIADSLKQAADLKLSLQVDFEITKTSKLNIMLDKATGDYLNVYGDANISIAQQPGRELTLNGKFTIDHGEYLLSINQFVKRKFVVVKGSTLKWSGSPTDADINLEALYNIDASVSPLLSGSQSTADESYQQRLPFELYLMLKDKLLKPKISFRLDMPAKDQNAFSGAVYARIKQINLQEAELNKQSMGLLIFKQFIPQDPMASSNAGYSLIDVQSAARNTAGEILSGQLNSIMASHVKAVDVSFDFESNSDYSTGSKVDETDLTINLSKSLFNDRATVKVGSTFALSGSEAHKQNTAGLAGDVAVEYKLTPNGRYRAKVYSLNQYDSTIEGEVVQTGVSFIIFLDFGKFKEIFHSDKKK